MGIERGDLEDLDGRQRHLLGQRDDLVLADPVVLILDQMQVFDQQVATARPVAQQPADLVQDVGIDNPPLGKGRRVAPARPGVERSGNGTIP